MEEKQLTPKEAARYFARGLTAHAVRKWMIVGVLGRNTGKSRIFLSHTREGKRLFTTEAHIAQFKIDCNSAWRTEER